MFRNLAISTLFVLSTCAPAMAQTCGPQDRIRDTLKNTYDEIPVIMGITNSEGFLMEVWESNEGTWTVTITDPNGTLCIVETGHTLMISGNPTTQESF